MARDFFRFLHLSMVRMSTKLLQKQSFHCKEFIQVVHEVRAWSSSGPSCGHHHKSWRNMKYGTNYEGDVRPTVGTRCPSVWPTEGVQSMRSWHQRGLTHVATDKISFHNWCCACPFVGNRKKVVRCLHDFLGKSVPSGVKFLGRRDEEWIYIPMGMNCIWGFVFGGKSQFQMRNKQAMKGTNKCDKYSDIIGGSSRKSNNCRQSARESTSRAKLPCQQS